MSVRSNMISGSDLNFIEQSSKRKKEGKYCTKNNSLCLQNSFSLAPVNTFWLILRDLLIFLACEVIANISLKRHKLKNKDDRFNSNRKSLVVLLVSSRWCTFIYQNVQKSKKMDHFKLTHSNKFDIKKALYFKVDINITSSNYSFMTMNCIKLLLHA